MKVVIPLKNENENEPEALFSEHLTYIYDKSKNRTLTATEMFVCFLLALSKRTSKRGNKKMHKNCSRKENLINQHGI